MKKITKTKTIKKIEKPEKRIVKIIKIAPKDEELISLIQPLIPAPIKGDKGDSIEGKPGKPGTPGKSPTKAQVRKIIDESLAEKMPDLMSSLEGTGKVLVEEAKEGYNLIIDGKKHFVPNAVYAPKLRNFIQMGDSPGTYVGAAGKLLAVNSTETGIEYVSGGGGGAVDSVNGQTGVVVLDQDDIGDGTTYKQYSATEKTKLAGIETGAEVNTIDTVSDTTEIDLAITARDLTATIRSGSIDETKLDTSVNASLDLADTAVQPAGLSGYELLSNKATDFTTINNTLYPTVQAVNTAINTAVTGLLDYRGSYDASANLFPATGGSGILGAILSGDFWICSVAGTLGGTPVTNGDLIIAIVDTPGQTAGNWDLIENTLGYTPENVANKENTTIDTNTTKYPTVNLLKTGLDTKQATLVSGTNIKTVNSTTLLGSGDLAVATTAQGALADSALQPGDIASGTITARADDINFSGGSDGDVLTVQADGSLALETPGGGSGTVTSVAISGSDGLEVDSGSPITTSGTIALGVNKTALLAHINVEDGADVTDATNVNAAGAVMNSDYTPAHSILVQQSGTGSPTIVQIPNSTIVGRIAGGGSDIDALTASEVRTIINVEDGADVTDTANVTAAGALMDSEVDADIKTLSLPANTTITTASASVLDDTTVADMVNTLGGATSTGTGGLVRAGSPALITPSIAAITVSGGTLTLPTGASDTLVSKNSTDTLTNKTLTSPTLTTPALGTPASGVLTNCTGLPTAGLVDDAVTLAKMAAGTAGNLITYDASGNPAAVATGTAGQVLTSNGAGAAPTMQDAAGGGATATVITPLPSQGVDGGLLGIVYSSNTTGYTMSYDLMFEITVNSIDIRASGTPSVAGTIDIGIYSEDGQTKHIDVTSGTISANAIYHVAVSAVTLPAGRYYLVIVPNGTANVELNAWDIVGVNFGDTGEPVLCGTQTVTASTLPATFNPSSAVTFSNSSYAPLIRLNN